MYVCETASSLRRGEGTLKVTGTGTGPGSVSIRYGQTGWNGEMAGANKGRATLGMVGYHSLCHTFLLIGYVEYLKYQSR